MKISLNPSYPREKPSGLKLLILFIVMVMAGNAACCQDLTSIGRQKPLELNGSIEAGSTMYSASGIADRRQPFSYLLNGNSTLNIYGISVPFSVSYTRSQSSFSQPFNQFGMSPTYKWITIHFGYRSIEYSPYTLAGHTILGAGIDLTPGKWRIGFMYGRLNSSTKVDTASQALVPYSFSRKAIAVKLGYGSVRNFFELSYLTAHDDSTSVARTSIPSALFIAPAANYALGFNSRFTFAKHIIFENQGAVSAYTRDMNSPYTLDAVNNDLIQKMRKYFTLNGTSEIYTAFSSSLGYQANTSGIKVSYKRIDPDFQSMGAYFLNSDAESWTIDPRLGIFKNKLRISGSAGFQHDNLLHQKRTTNRRIITSANMSADVTPFLSVDGSYANFSNDQQPNTQRFPDSLRIVQTTQNIMISPRFTIIRPTVIQLISLSVASNQLNDLNQVITSNQALNITMSTSQYFINYSISFPRQNFGLVGNINRTVLQGEAINSTYQGVSLGGYANLAHNKLQINLYNSITQGSGSTGNTETSTSTATLSYRIFKKHILKTAMYLTSNHPDPGSSQQAFTEFRNELSYIINF